jgi:hypothetical protein
VGEKRKEKEKEKKEKKKPGGVHSTGPRLQTARLLSFSN